MFPLNDFHFVACALATFSVAVGYNVSRRRGRNSISGPRQAESERAKKESRLGFLKFHRRNSTGRARSLSVAPSISESDTGTESPATQCGTLVITDRENENEQSPTEEIAFPEDGMLKRKRSASPELAQQSIDTPPTKRRRTPPIEEEHEQNNVKIEEPTLHLCSPKCDDPPLVQPEDATCAATSSDEVPVVTEQDSTPRVQQHPANSQTAPYGLPQGLASTIAVVRPPSVGPSWHARPSLTAAKPSSAFSAFSGQHSAFAISLTGSQNTPVWSTHTRNSGFALNEPLQAFAPSDSSDPLAALTRPIPNAEKVLTGEEDENVQAELKGAKVFIKRGDHEFCEGILGNVKILRHKETGHLRILFRREPIWKVTMSVRLRSTVRCTFDEAQGALRVTLKEPMENTQREHLVIYALRRGKASRSEFADFAKAVVENCQLQGKTLV